MNHLHTISEISAGDFNTLPLIIEDYTNSRVIEVTRRLRALQVYPVGAQQITYGQASLLLYLLSANKGPDSTIKILDQDPIKDQSGESFISAFASILAGQQPNVIEVFISPYVCEIRTTDTVKTFGTGAKGEGFTFRKDKLYYYRHYLLNGWQSTGTNEQTQKIQKNWLGIEPEFELPENPDQGKPATYLDNWEQAGIINK
jgi:hypothetical protein